tara:strand:+ start:17261 stop:17611 length:351 start_codon:yes stop_codon:yes gene_type:complete
MATKPIRKRVRKHGARGTATISSSMNKEESVKDVSREIDSVIKDTNAAYVRVDGGITKNLGDYNSARISVSVNMPCEPNEKAIRKCYKKTSTLVDEFIDEEYKAVVGDRGGEGETE